MNASVSYPHLTAAQDLIDPVRDALRGWRSPSVAPTPLTQLFLYRRVACSAPDMAPRHLLNQLILDELATMADEDARLLRQRFLHDTPSFQVANQFNVAESTLYKKQKAALERLAEQIFRAEEKARSQNLPELTAHLPRPTYTHLFGVETHISRLSKVLASPVPPWIIAIEGLGGIGKTALADALARYLASVVAYDRLGWVSAKSVGLDLLGTLRPETSPALSVEEMVAALLAQLRPDLPLPGPERALSLLRELLRTAPHLIVIDNLESLTDVESLLPTLGTLTDPSRFLLTSRRSLRAETHIFAYRVPELDQANSLSLLRYEAEQTNRPDLLVGDALDSIYAAVGGNPLALRLLIGQSYVHSLDRLLADLRQARGQASENLYTFIYRQAWDYLDEATRLIFLSMAAVDPAGVSANFLAQVASVPPEALFGPLQQLVMLNLVNVSVGLDKRYSMHSLTRTFLIEQVARWR